MTNAQLYLAIGVPVVINAALIGMLLAYMNARFSAVNQRFDDVRELWRSELQRVEGVLDARLSHIEDKLGIG